MHYAVPAVLAKRGMLSEFWTDMHNQDWPARLIRALTPPSARPKILRGMLGRTLPAPIPRGLVRSFPCRAIWHRLLGAHPDKSINSQIIRKGLGRSQGLYSVMFGDAEVIDAAKRAGMYIAFEQVVTPEMPDILWAERERFHGVEQQESKDDDALYLRKHLNIWSNANIVISPSDYVMQGLARLGGDARKVRLVPYAVDDTWFGNQPRVIPGRVLFVGSVGLRKGSHYLAEATRLLRQRRVPCEIRVVGPVTAQTARNEMFTGPTYVGRVPRSAVVEEYLTADIFVLPTLAEGAATAHIEALACGIPVITTPNCGTLIQHGQEGFIINPSDTEGLAEKIEQLVTRRHLRDQMGANAKELALREHTWSAYEQRLVNALTPTVPNRSST